MTSPIARHALTTLTVVLPKTLHIVYLFSVFLAGAAGAIAQQHAKVALSTDTKPGGGTFTTLNPGVLTNSGTVIFKDNFYGLFQWTANGVENFVRYGTAAPEGGTFSGVNAYAVGASGDVGFTATTSIDGKENLFLKDASGLRAIARVGQSAPSGGSFKSFYSFSIASPGLVAFSASTLGGGGEGVYLGSASTVTTVATVGDSTPSGAYFVGFGNTAPAPVINRFGQVVFFAWDGSNFGIYLKTGSAMVRLAYGAGNGYSNLMLNDGGQASFTPLGRIFFGATANLVPILTDGTVLPDGHALFNIGNPVANESGQIAFAEIGVDAIHIRSASGVITRIAKSESPAPGGGLFNGGGSSYFSLPVVNTLGHVTFVANAGSSNRVFFWDGSSLSKVIGAGDSLAGSTVSDVSIAPPGSTPAHRAINDSDQIVYRATFTNGTSGIFVYTPPSVRITNFEIVSGKPRVSFTSSVGRNYAVERKADLRDPMWTTVTDASSVAGTGAIVQVDDPDPGAGSADRMFYRVKLLP